MDPAAIGHRKQPDDEGYVFVDGSRLHYELYRPSGGYSSDSSNSSSSCGSQTNKAPLLMVMGAFATKVHFADMAKYLADTSGHEVLIYDHRGVGRSSNPRLEAQTAAQLAADSLVVTDTIWGASTPIHVYGCVPSGSFAGQCQGQRLLCVLDPPLFCLYLAQVLCSCLCHTYNVEYNVASIIHGHL
jgi:hypothetical protein